MHNAKVKIKTSLVNYLKQHFTFHFVFSHMDIPGTVILKYNFAMEYISVQASF